MGSCDRFDIHGDRGSHNSILVDLNLAIKVYSEVLKEVQKLSEGFGHSI